MSTKDHPTPAPTAAGSTDCVLRDPLLNAQLARDGIVQVPLLDASRIDHLTRLYHSVVPPGESGIKLDYVREDVGIKRELNRMLDEVFQEVIPLHFASHYPVYSSFVAKHPGPDSAMFLHRDLPVNDERFVQSYSLWIPLTDVSPELDNGTFEIVQRSHRIPLGAFSLEGPIQFVAFQDYLCERLVPLSVAAGTALVYDARLIHASGPNRTSRPRLAIGSLMCAKDAPLVHVSPSGRRHRRVYAVDTAFFTDYRPADLHESGMPDGYEVIDEFDEDFRLSPEELRLALADPGTPTRIVHLPSDVAEMGLGERPFPLLPELRSPTRRTDLTTTAEGLSPFDPECIGIVATRSVGQVGGLALISRSRRRGKLPEVLSNLEALLAPVAVRHAALLVMDANSRITLTFPERMGHHDELLVIEAPTVGAGIGDKDCRGELDVGMRFLMPTVRPVVLWNNGPGPVVVLVRSMPSLPSFSSFRRGARLRLGRQWVRSRSRLRWDRP